MSAGCRVRVQPCGTFWPIQRITNGRKNSSLVVWGTSTLVKLVIPYLSKKKKQTAKHDKILGKPFHYMRSVIERGVGKTEKTGKLLI